MIRVKINEIEVSSFNQSEIDVLTSWQNRLVSDITKFVTKRTNQISLPVSKELNRALEHPVLLDSNETNTDKPTIKIYDNEQIVVDGYIKLTSATALVTSGTVNFTVIPIERDFYSSLKGFKMNELDLSTNKHEMVGSDLWTNFLDSGSIGTEYAYAGVDTGYLGHRSIIWMYQSGSTTIIYYAGEQLDASGETVTLVGNADNAFNIEVTLARSTSTYWNSLGFYAATTTDLPIKDGAYRQRGYFPNNSAEQWQVHDFAPMIQMDYLFEKVVANTGWTLVNDGVTEVLADYWHFKENETNRAIGLNSRTEFKVGIQDGHYQLTGLGSGDLDVPYQSLTKEDLKANSNYTDTNSGTLANVVAKTHVSKFTTPEQGFYEFKVRCYFVGNATNIKLSIYNSGGTLISTVENRALVTASGYYDITMEGVGYMDTDYYAKVVITFDTGTFTPVIYEQSTFEGRRITKMLEGTDVYLEDYLDNESALKWFLDVAQLFNVRVYPNDRKKELYVCLDESNMEDKVVDFSKRLDQSQAVEIRKISKEYAQTLYFNYLTDSNDETMQVVEDVSGRYARGTITNTDPFAEGEEDYSLSIYSATLKGEEQSATWNKLGFPIMNGEDGSRKDFTSRLFKLTYGSVSLYVNEVDVDQTFYYTGSATSYSNVSFPIAEFPSELFYSNLISNYWERFKNLILYGYILKGSFYLDKSVLSLLNETSDNAFRSWYNIELNKSTARAELLRIADYQPFLTNKTTIVELIWMKRN